MTSIGRSALGDHAEHRLGAHADEAAERPTRWLLVEQPTDKAEPVKYWLSNLPQTTPLVELVRLGKLRWRQSRTTAHAHLLGQRLPCLQAPNARPAKRLRQ